MQRESAVCKGKHEHSSQYQGKSQKIRQRKPGSQPEHGYDHRGYRFHASHDAAL